MSRLTNISGYVPYMVIVFLNAFVDLGHKIIDEFVDIRPSQYFATHCYSLL